MINLKLCEETTSVCQFCKILKSAKLSFKYLIFPYFVSYIERGSIIFPQEIKLYRDLK